MTYQPKRMQVDLPALGHQITKDLQGFGDGKPRDYLNEAYLIVRGEGLFGKTAQPTREHLQAMAARISELAAQLEPFGRL